MAKAVYAVELKPGVGVASFMAGGTAIELSDENPRFETDDEGEFARVRDLPFLKVVGDKPVKAGAAE